MNDAAQCVSRGWGVMVAQRFTVESTRRRDSRGLERDVCGRHESWASKALNRTESPNISGSSELLAASANLHPPDAQRLKA